MRHRQARSDVGDDCDEIMPAWLNFVKGVVDPEDFPLNIFRQTQHQNMFSRVNKEVCCLRSIDGAKFEDKPLATLVKNYKTSIADSIEQLGAKRERLDAVAKGTAELVASVAKATKMKQEEHVELVTVTVTNAETSTLLGLGNRSREQVLRDCNSKGSTERSEGGVLDNMSGEITAASHGRRKYCCAAIAAPARICGGILHLEVQGENGRILWSGDTHGGFDG